MTRGDWRSSELAREHLAARRRRWQRLLTERGIDGRAAHLVTLQLYTGDDWRALLSDLGGAACLVVLFVVLGVA